jgi:predicted small lipoprotein YifL
MEAEMNRAQFLIASLVLATVAGCGRQGDLYLPSAARDIVTRPVQSPEPGGTPASSNSPQSVDSPETPASPAPEVTAPEVAVPEGPEDSTKKNGAPPPKK